MTAKRNNAHRRNGTRFSGDGCTVFVKLRVDRRGYEFARSWSALHAPAFPDGTAEDQLEGYLNAALLAHMDDLDWIAPSEIEALYPNQEKGRLERDDLDDDIPF
ncbi:MAG: hypothetical protein H6843_08920 [Rhodospirillaceae bacterium]|nr:hypothetical protein [Rhodospirillaceae bacterium]